MTTGLCLLSLPGTRGQAVAVPVGYLRVSGLGLGACFQPAVDEVVPAHPVTVVGDGRDGRLTVVNIEGNGPRIGVAS